MYFTEDKIKVISDFNSNAQNGLTKEQVQANFEKYGANKLKEKKKKTILELFLGDFITLWVVFFLRNLIFYDEYETCGFDFCADGGGAAVGGSKWWFHFGKV